MSVVKTNIYRGDCLYVLQDLPDNSIDLIFTSPPYADSRSKTYGGIKRMKRNDYNLSVHLSGQAASSLFTVGYASILNAITTDAE